MVPTLYGRQANWLGVVWSYVRWDGRDNPNKEIEEDCLALPYCLIVPVTHTDPQMSLAVQLIVADHFDIWSSRTGN